VVRDDGWAKYDQGVSAVLETSEHHTVVLTSRGTALISLEQVLSLGIDRESNRILIVKGVVAPRAAYEPIAAKHYSRGYAWVTSNDPRQFPISKETSTTMPT
jgi:microcystin degradation protein MlrC